MDNQSNPTIARIESLIALTERLTALITEQAQPFADAPLALRAKLVRATEAFDAVIARQGRALGAAMKVTEGLVHAIAEEVANQRSAQSGYGPTGVKPRRDAATSVTLNRRA